MSDKTVNGVRVRRIQTYPSRFSKGNVHLEGWLPTTSDWVHTRQGKGWVPVCNPNTTYHSRDVEDGSVLAVDCGKCLRSGLVPGEWQPSDNLVV